MKKGHNKRKNKRKKAQTHQKLMAKHEHHKARVEALAEARRRRKFAKALEAAQAEPMAPLTAEEIAERVKEQEQRRNQ